MAKYEERKDEALKLLEASKFSEAAAAFRELAEGAPDSDERAAALIGEYQCLEALGMFAKARESVHEAASLGEQTPEYLARMVYFEACLDANEGKNEMAVEKLNKLLEEHADLLHTPECLDLYESIQYQRAEYLSNLNRMGQALPLFLETRGFKKEKPKDFIFRMAFCVAKCGDFERAHVLMKRALADCRDIRQENMARYYLGLIYAAARDYGKALAEFQFCEAHLDEFDLSIPSLMEALSYVCEKSGRTGGAAKYRRAGGAQKNHKEP
jgi:tetratricopeptide (TPR) repeat protein